MIKRAGGSTVNVSVFIYLFMATNVLGIIIVFFRLNIPPEREGKELRKN